MTPRSRILAAVLAVAAAVASAPDPHAAAQRPPDRVRFRAAPDETLLVHGTYPRVESSCVGERPQPILHERYRGAVEVRRASDGSLFLVGELPFEDYLKGIAEVPRRWPMDALKAQVVAARTYALSQLDPGGLYDLCATDACQVYVGTGVELGPWGHRWARAVEETAGEALLHRGEPAVTFYSSTSPGRTFDNEDVFGGEPLPYLRGQEERDDGASPVSRWEVRIPFAHLSRFLARDGRWGGGPIRRVKVDDGAITVRGPGGKVTLTKADLRDAVNDTASCLMPSRYPTTASDGDRLPQAVPSVWYRVRPQDRSIVLTGRGWGHGVGMVQWGAYGKARRGLAYDDILAAYYGGLRPQRPDVPDSIRVLLAEGLTAVTVAPSGEVDIEGREKGPRPPWRVSGGPRLRVRHGSRPAPVLEAGDFEAGGRARGGRPVTAELELSKPASVRLELLEDADPVASTRWKPFEEGLVEARFRLPEVDRGSYLVRAVVSDGVDTVRTAARPLRVSRGSRPSPSPSPSLAPSPERSGDRGAAASPAARSAPPPALSAVAVALAALTLLGLLLRRGRRKGLHRR